MAKRLGENELIIRLWSFVWQRHLYNQKVVRVKAWNIAVVENKQYPGDRQIIMVVHREKNRP